MHLCPGPPGVPPKLWGPDGSLNSNYYGGVRA